MIPQAEISRLKLAVEPPMLFIGQRSERFELFGGYTMKLANLLRVVCVGLACLLPLGCSSSEEGSDAGTTATDANSNKKNGGETAGDKPATDASDDGKSSDGDDGGDSAGESTATDAAQDKQPQGLTDEEIGQHFKDAKVLGSIRRGDNALALQIRIHEGDELTLLNEFFALVPETNHLALIYSAEASLERPVVDLTPLKQLPALTDLDIGEIAVLPSSLAELQGLRRLDLTGAKITDELLEAVASLPKVQKLTLAVTTLNDENLTKLHGMKNLVELDARQTQVTIAGAKKMRRAIAYLKVTLSADAAPE
jgi:hypothetical protein